jgi:MFS family permease
VLLATQSLLGLGAVLLAVLSATRMLQVWHLVALGVLQGIAFSFNMPARQAFVAELVGGPLLRNAVALNNAGMNFCRVAGPALAGALLAVPGIGVNGVFVVMALMYVVVLASLLRLPRRPRDERGGAAGRARSSSWEQLLEGLGYLRASPVLLALLGMGFLAMFFGMPFQTLMPLFAERVFGVGAGGLGVLMSAVGLGALAGSLTIAALSRVSRPALLQVGFGIAFGVGLVAFGLAPSFLFAVLALVVVGFASSAFAALNNTMVMANTEPRLYGRVMSVYLLTFATMPLGAFPLALLADQLGGPAVVAGAGLVVAGAIGGVGLLYPAYRRIR